MQICDYFVMTNTSLYAELVKLVPVFVGALLAICGGLGSQIFIHKLTARREIANLHRDRLEALIKAVYSHGNWIQEKQTKMVFRNEDHDVASPLDEARMIQTLHFPELANEILAIQQTQIPLIKFINDERIKHMKDKRTFIEGWNPAEFEESYKKYLEAVNAITNKCRNIFESTKKS
jgi:hypothetical protein